MIIALKKIKLKKKKKETSTAFLTECKLIKFWDCSVAEIVAHFPSVLLWLIGVLFNTRKIGAT